MADTLPRESIAYGSQPLSPVPCYWDGSSYPKVQGINGAIRVINYTSSGETFTGSSPGSVQLTSTSTVAISGTSTIDVSGAITVEFSATQTVEIVTSAGGTTLFSSANPAPVQLTATSTVSFSGSETVNISGTATVNFSGSGTVTNTGSFSVAFTSSQTVVISGTSTVTFSGTETIVISGTSTVTFSGSETVDIQTIPVVGSQANAWSASATITSGATSNAIDVQYVSNISIFGASTNTATLTLYIEASQDNSNFYTNTSSLTISISAGTSANFYQSVPSFGARYIRLTSSGVSATITATIAGK